MYRLAVDKNKLYDPNFPDYHLENPTLKLAANKLATLTFTVYDTNPSFNLIQKRKSVIKVYRDDEVIAMVRPIKTKLNFRGGIDYTCEDCLARLNDVLKRPGYFKGTQAQYLSHMLSDWSTRYNATIPTSELGDRDLYKGVRGEDVRQMQAALMELDYDLGSYGADGIFGTWTDRAVRSFQSDEGLTIDGVFGTEELDALLARITPHETTDTVIDIVVGTTPHSGVDEVEFINDDYVGYWDLLQQKLIDEYGGYLVPRWTEGTGQTHDTITLSYMDNEDLVESEQEIKFGDNLSDLFIETDSSETFSVLIPLGADVRASRQSQEQAENTPLTIASVNNGKDYLESEDGLTLYGRKEATMRWDDIKNASDLKAKGVEYLNEHAIQMKEKITLTAVDLHYIDVNIEYLDFLSGVHVTSLKHNIIGVYPLTEIVLTLGRPDSSKLTLGDEEETLTDRMTKNVNTANGQYNKLSGRVFNLENPN